MTRLVKRERTTISYEVRPPSVLAKGSRRLLAPGSPSLRAWFASVLVKGSEWQLALGLPSTFARLGKMERDTFSYRA
jgi:hypothetical protein